MFLPMIDLNPSDSTCIFSTLKYVRQHAQRHNVTPVITFDQPLWWKALMIVNSQPMESDLRQIVLRLGGFHAEMSFLGCFGHLMASSGLQEVLELIYAPKTVIHMMSGKAVARAVRAHSIVDASLNALILADVFNVNLPQQSGTSDKSKEGESESAESVTAMETNDSDGDQVTEVSRDADVDEALEIYKNLMDGTISAKEASQSDVLVRIKGRLQKHIESIKKNFSSLDAVHGYARHPTKCLSAEVSQALIVITPECVAFFRDKSGRYGVFDSHTRNAAGLPHHYGTAIMMTFSKLSDLADHLHKLFKNHGAHASYEFVPVLFDTVGSSEHCQQLADPTKDTQSETLPCTPQAEVPTADINFSSAPQVVPQTASVSKLNTQRRQKARRNASASKDQHAPLSCSLVLTRPSYSFHSY
ncbi:hypothetical protein N1851_030972 [Merluccius polli]|uniref:Uncharacterized protein n=1 Tax=Merluccius polli TaxID=89951 RepID=A0AA47M4J1_MERPO|nr:hypothetical protein N1851_030972 [Merluccius polli]